MNRRSITMILLTILATFAVTGCKKDKQKEDEPDKGIDKPKSLNKILYLAGTLDYPYKTQFYTVNSDGTNETQLTTLPNPDHLQIYAPAWSPDGTKIIFISNESGREMYDIYIMNADGTGATKLTNSPSRIEYQPSFSADGKTILFGAAINQAIPSILEISVILFSPFQTKVSILILPNSCPSFSSWYSPCPGRSASIN